MPRIWNFYSIFFFLKIYKTYVYLHSAINFLTIYSGRRSYNLQNTVCKHFDSLKVESFFFFFLNMLDYFCFSSVNSLGLYFPQQWKVRNCLSGSQSYKVASYCLSCLVEIEETTQGISHFTQWKDTVQPSAHYLVFRLSKYIGIRL